MDFSNSSDQFLTRWPLAQPKPKAPNVKNVLGARKAKVPGFISPQLATLVKEPPSGDQWLHELKFDGYRMLCRIDRF